MDKIVVRIYQKDTLVEPNPDLLIETANALVENLSKDFDSSYIRNILYKLDDINMDEVYDEFYNNLPLYLEEDDYKRLDTITSREKIVAKFQENYNVLISPAGIGMKKFLIKDPLGISGDALKKLETLQLDQNFILYNDYIFTEDKRNLLVLISSAVALNDFKLFLRVF